MQDWKASEARSRWADILDAAASGDWQRIDPQRREPVLVARVRDLALLLEKAAPFSPEVLYEEDGSVTIWLNELDVYGMGGSLAEAADDLIDSVREYVEDWEEDLGQAPNHRDRVWHVRRLQLAADQEQLCRVVFGDDLAPKLCRHPVPA
jgi:Antitoxin of toxin-antitoxin, RelE / RelB, TA system